MLIFIESFATFEWYCKLWNTAQTREMLSKFHEVWFLRKTKDFFKVLLFGSIKVSFNHDPDSWQMLFIQPVTTESNILIVLQNIPSFKQHFNFKMSTKESNYCYLMSTLWHQCFWLKLRPVSIINRCATAGQSTAAGLDNGPHGCNPNFNLRSCPR